MQGVGQVCLLETLEDVFMKNIASQHVIVIGAGITGVTTAYALSQLGFSVTVVEKNRYQGMETSYANGGQLSASNAEVWTHPSTLIKGLKWIFKNNAPLLVNPLPTWHKLSWVTEFIAAIPQYQINTVETARMAIESRQHHLLWAKAEGIEFDHREEGILHIYRDQKGFDHAGRVSELLAQAGLARRAVTPQEMKKIEPTLMGQFYGGYFTESDSTGDIHKFTQGLSKACERMGVRFLNHHEVLCAQSNGHKVTMKLQHQDQTDTITADGVVVCAGVHSRRMAAQLGDRLNIYPVKGYSITVNMPLDSSRAAAPKVSLLDDETKLVCSRLGEDRFRVAGTAEFNGMNLDIRADRIKPLIDWVNSCFPGIDTRSVVPWAGLRPMTPNMIPKVGLGTKSNVFYNTGHGHLGWTLAALTAHQLTQHVLAWSRSLSVTNMGNQWHKHEISRHGTP